MSWLANMFRRKEPLWLRQMQRDHALIHGIRPGNQSIRILYTPENIFIAVAPNGLLHSLQAPFWAYWDDDNPGKVGVRAGTVWTGDAGIDVSELTPVTVSDGDWFILTITYYHDGTNDTAILSKTSTAPSDTLSYTASADPSEGASTHIIPIAKVDSTYDNGIIQHQWGDVYLLKGKTWQQKYLIDITYNEGSNHKLQFKYNVVTWVNGSIYNIGTETSNDIFSSIEKIIVTGSIYNTASKQFTNSRRKIRVLEDTSQTAETVFTATGCP